MRIHKRARALRTVCSGRACGCPAERAAVLASHSAWGNPGAQLAAGALAPRSWSCLQGGSKHVPGLLPLVASWSSNYFLLWCAPGQGRRQPHNGLGEGRTSASRNGRARIFMRRRPGFETPALRVRRLLCAPPRLKEDESMMTRSKKVGPLAALRRCVS